MCLQSVPSLLADLNKDLNDNLLSPLARQLEETAATNSRILTINFVDLHYLKIFIISLMNTTKKGFLDATLLYPYYQR